LTGYELDIVADRGVEPAAAVSKEESKPVTQQKLKKKTELESSLLEAIEQHGE
jgi:hypothetical protein